jgi:hypothetical protein
MKVWNRESGQCQSHVCNEENTVRIIEDDHTSKGKGTYTDTSGAEISVDWTQSRLVYFVRKNED